MLALSNGHAEPLAVWFEPWAEEHLLPPRSLLTLDITAEPVMPEAEPTDTG